MSVAELHGDTLAQAQIGNALGKQIFADREGTVNQRQIGDTPNQHDMLTGSQGDGRAYTDTARSHCSNYDEQCRRDGLGPNSVTWTSRAATTGRGTRRTRAAAAASPIWLPPAAPDCSTVSR